MQTSASSLVPPHGLDQIVSTFGDIFDYIGEDHTLDPRWQTEMLQSVPLPFAIPLSWDKTRPVQRMTCHKLLAGTCTAAFTRIQNEGLQAKVTSFGGCFSFRPQRTGARLSTHAWGIAIDLNPESNEQGTAGNMDPALISIFKTAGFSWGRRLAGQGARSHALSVLHGILIGGRLFITSGPRSSS